MASGQLGRDTLTSTCLENGINRCSNWPIPVAGGLKFTRVSAGSWETQLRRDDERRGILLGVKWVEPTWQRLLPPIDAGFPIDQGYPCSHIPLRVEGGVGLQVRQGQAVYFTCGLSDSGEGYCWGYGVTTANLGQRRET